MSFKVQAFTKTAARILPVLLILAILLLTGCPPASKTQGCNIKCTLTKTDGTTENYEFYRGAVNSINSELTRKLKNGTIPVCSQRSENEYVLGGTAGPHAPLDMEGEPQVPCSYIKILMNHDDTEFLISQISLTDASAEDRITYWKLDGQTLPKLAVIQTPENVDDVFAASFTAKVMTPEGGDSATLSGSFYLKRMDDGIALSF